MELRGVRLAEAAQRASHAHDGKNHDENHGQHDACDGFSGFLICQDGGRNLLQGRGDGYAHSASPSSRAAEQRRLVLRCDDL